MSGGIEVVKTLVDDILRQRLVHGDEEGMKLSWPPYTHSDSDVRACTPMIRKITSEKCTISILLIHFLLPPYTNLSIIFSLSIKYLYNME